MLQGKITAAVTPKSFGVSNEKHPFILGNDYGSKLLWQPETLAVAAVTRNKAKKASTNVDVNGEGTKARKNNISSDVIINKTADVDVDNVIDCNVIDNVDNESVTVS